MPSRLTDGIPITTEWLNSLVDAINDINSGSGTTTGTTSSQRSISVLGQYFNDSSRAVQIIADSVTGTAVAGEDTKEFTVNFPTQFADNNVIVVATSAFVSQGTRKNRPFKAAASVGLTTSKKFELSVVLTDDSGAAAEFNKGKQVIVNYIAIGKKL
jgi:hypothetical protein